MSGYRGKKTRLGILDIGSYHFLFHRRGGLIAAQCHRRVRQPLAAVGEHVDRGEYLTVGLIEQQRQTAAHTFVIIGQQWLDY